MNPELIVFAIRSVARLWNVSNEALEERARNTTILFPSIEDPDPTVCTDLTGFFNQAENRAFVVGPSAPYAQYWEQTHVKRDAASVDALLIAATKITAERGGVFSQADNPPAVTLVKQWNRKNQPASPWSRIILTAADIALEYLAANPALLGAKGNGEKLLAAYAASLSQVLPDDGNLGPKERFGERLLSLFLRAGLSTVNEHPEWVVAEDHVAELINASVTPLLAQWDSDPTTQLKWQDISDALMGPAASAAMLALAKHQSAFLGQSVDPYRALGAITQALFLEAAKQRLSDASARERLLGLYTAVLDVAIGHPKLFLGDGQTPTAELNRKLFAEVVTIVQQSPPPFDREVGTALVSVALDAAAAHAARLGQSSDEWRQAGLQTLHLLSKGLSDGLRNNAKLSAILSREQLTEIGRILLSCIADTPAVVVGAGNEALQGLLHAVTSAMIGDPHLLLSGEDWLQIVAVAAEEAAANPARLFKLDPNRPSKVLAGELISMVLNSAADAVKNSNSGLTAVLYGKTLREAIIVLLRATAGNPQAVQAHMETIQRFLGKLNELVAANPRWLGSKEWLRLFRMLLPAALEGRDTGTLDLARAEELLKGVL